MSLGIPDAIVPGIELLANLSDAESEKVLAVASALGMRADGKNLEELQDALENATDLEPDDSEEMSIALLSFLNLRERYKSDQELVEDLADAVGHHNTLDWDRESLSSFLSALFARATGLRLRLKARSLEYDRERTMLDAQIVTDVRPVYDLEEEPSDIVGYVVNNTLKIEYIDQNSANRRARVMYFGVDDTDLEKLSFLLKRADQKREHMARDLAALNKPLLGEPKDG